MWFRVRVSTSCPSSPVSLFLLWVLRISAEQQGPLGKRIVHGLQGNLVHILGWARPLIVTTRNSYNV